MQHPHNIPRRHERRDEVKITIRPDLPPERSMSPLPSSPSARESGPPLNPALGFRPVGSSLARPAHRSTPSATVRPSSIERWKATVAAQVSAIQREGWRKGLFGRARLSRAAGGGVETTLKRAGQGLARLLVAQSDPLSPKPHLHGDSDLAVPPSPGLGRTGRIPTLSRLGQLVVLVLFVLGVREVLHTAFGTSRPFQSVRVRGRHPRSVLSDVAPPKSRYATSVPGMERHWFADQSSLDPYSDAKTVGDTTAIVLHWKRTENVAVILAHLCQYSFFDSVFVWNNNPDIRLTQQTFAKSGCAPSKLRIYNSPRNMLFVARYLACLQSSTPHCFFQDDDWVVQPLRAMYAQFSRDPEGPVVVHTNEEVAALYGLEWCFFNNPLHTCFSWVGTGAFTSRQHVERFMRLTSELAYSRDELGHADNSFTLFQNEPPYVLTSKLSQLPSPYGHSDGEGIARNKAFIHKGLVRLSSYLNTSFPPPPSPDTPLTNVRTISPVPYRPSLPEPLSPHPYAHHARSLCLPSDSCIFHTNIALLPPPDATPYPGPERVGSLQRWEEHLGWVARGWIEGEELWREEETWAREWAYQFAVDGDEKTAFRSPDVVRAGDYIALSLLAPLDAAWTPTVKLNIILEDAVKVLSSGKIRVEVSVDGHHWVRARHPTSPNAPPVIRCPSRSLHRSPLSLHSTLPSPSFPDSRLISPLARRLLAAEQAAEASSGVVQRWWQRTKRRRASGVRECEVSVSAALPSSSAPAKDGGLEPGWRFVRLLAVSNAAKEEKGADGDELLDVGWGVYEMWLVAEKGPPEDRLSPLATSASRCRACDERSSSLSSIHPSGPPPGLWPPGGASAQQQGAPQGTQGQTGQAQQSGASTSLLTIVRAQIVFLLSTLSEDNFNKNRDEIRSLIDLHGPAPHAHLIRRLIQGAATLLTASPASPPPSSASQPPSPELHLRLLASEVQRCAREPALAERFRDAVLEGAEGPSGSDSVLRSFSLSTLVSHPNLSELSPLERLVFCAPFLTLLFPSATPPTGLKRAIGLDAAKLIRQSLHPALEQLGSPPSTVHDLAELSPLPISRLLSILLSDIYLGEAPPSDSDSPESLFSDDDRRAIVLSALRLSLTPSPFTEAALDDNKRRPSAVSILSRFAPVPALSTPDLVRNVMSRYGGLSSDGSDVGSAEMRVAQQLFELIDLATKEGDNGRGVDVASWVRAVHESQPALRWGDVVRAYDSPMRALPDHFGIRAFATLLQVSPAPPPTAEDPRANPPQTSGLGLVSAPGGTSAISGLWTQWGNPLLQFSLIDRLVFLASSPATPPGTSASTEPHLNLANLASVHKVVSVDDAAGSSPTIKALAHSVQNSPWNAQEVTTTLVRLGGDASNAELAGRVHELLDRGCKSNPELVLVALTQVEKPWNAIHAELTARLLSTFLAGHPSHQLVFLRLSQIDRQFLFAALRDFYAESEMNVTRIIDIAQDLKMLDQILELRPFVLALDLAALASRREYLNLDKWLTGQIQQHGGQLVRATLEFVGHKVQHELRRQELDHPPEPTTLALNAATIAIFMRVLRAHHELFTGNDVELFKEVRTQCLQLHPRLMNFSPKNSESEPGMAVTSFSPEIEAECDALYKRMYEQEISVDKVVTALRQAKDSDNQHDHEFFACFLHGLFDEHRFFNTYPPKELALTASLFGDLIQYHLIDFVPLGIAVRYVLDALRNPPDSNWFRFGIQALARFQSRLSEWPQLAHSILSIPHVQQLHPEVANTAREALLQREGGENGSSLGGLDVGPEQELPREPERLPFSAIHVEESGGDPEAPDEQTSDKILFIVNNLAPSNFETKVKDMVSRMEPLHFAWFAHYLVAQRVSIEPNNHQLYQQFLEALKMPKLVKRVLHETFVKLATLLNSDKTVQSSTERTLLKNLGSWLGGLTLAKDKPIRHSNIAFKQLLIEGYDSNRLIVAIPFVCKVLEQCSKSRVFRPPNPWLMAILRLLVELYQFAELKLNLKFEIEVLCKSLDVDLKDVEPTEILRNRSKELAAQQAAAAQAQAAVLPGQQGGVPQTSVELALANFAQQQQQAGAGGHLGQDVDEHGLRTGFASAAHHALPAAGAPGEAARLPPMLGVNQPGYSLSLQDTVSAALQNLPSLVVFNSQLPMFTSNPALKRLICLAIDRAVREIIAPVVERSVTIAGISTRELTMKDFAMEGDENNMATAAHLMVQNLAGSLALVTCKEPLRLSMIAHARTLLLQNGFTDDSLPEQAIQVIVAENLDLACSVVEKVAMEKAVLEVDEGLAPAYLARRSHRERSREAFWDTAAMAASHYSGMLPDPLRLKLGGLSPQQLQVYEDFARLRTLPPAADGRNGALYAESPAMAAANVPQAAAAAAAAAAVVADAGVLTAPQAMEKFAALLAELEQALAAESVPQLAGVGQESDLRRIVQQIPLVAASSASRDDTVLACSQKVVQLLYRSEGALARDAYVFLLDRLCAISPRVAKEVTDWLVYAEDERKFNVPVTVALLQARFINVADLDLQLAKFAVREFRATVVDFVAGVVAACLAEVPPVATREQFANSLEALSQGVRQGKATDAARKLLDDVQSRGTTSVRELSPSNLTSAEDAAVREQLTLCFAEWVRLYQQSHNIEKAFVDFVVQLQKQGILKGEEISSLFFRVCTEVSIDSYIKNKAAGGTPATGIFQPVDAFARLITFMIKYHADPTGANNDKAKVHYMNKVLSIVVLVLANSHEELGIHFQAKPFFRFFSSLLCNLAAIESHLGAAYSTILIGLSHSLNTCQPSIFPAFAFSWISLITHRFFMPKLLQMTESRDGWNAFLRQLVSLLRFLAPHLRLGKLSEVVRTLYIGTERLLLVLLKDFPDFVAQAAPALVDVLPSNAVQMTNLVLSAFPVQVATRLPDPLMPGLDLESLPEAQKAPAFLADYTAALTVSGILPVLDQYLVSGEPADFVSMVLARLDRPSAKVERGEPAVNVPLVNSLVLRLGATAINQHKAQKGQAGFDASSESFKTLRQLVERAAPETRYYLLLAVVNQLRFVSSHTAWFSKALLTIFAEAGEDDATKETSRVSEAILRVVLERSLAARPVPMGVQHSLSQLLRDHASTVEKVLSRLPNDDAGARALVSHFARLVQSPPAGPPAAA
ncbi:CCR4-NOT core subunit cdc39 [Rhodotorula toruloides]